jgi:hypothetical protein
LRCLALGITLAALHWLPRELTAPTMRSEASASPALATQTVAPLTTLLGQEHMPCLSPDGTRLLFAWESEAGAGFDLYIRPLELGAPDAPDPVAGRRRRRCVVA